MSLFLMKERIKQSGSTLYDEQIKDAQDILAYGFKDDISYNPNISIYKTNNKIPIKIYDQKSSASYGVTAKFLAPHNMPVELGENLYDSAKDEYWLCIESYNVSNIHNEGKLGKCMRILKWQDENGIIQEIPIIVTSAAKYNNGERGTEIITLPSDQLLLFAQLNEHTCKLDRGVKFFIDENINNPSVYEITRIDTALYTYMHKGFISIIATEHAYTPTEEELKLGVCNYTPPLPQSPIFSETTDLTAVILGNTYLKVGFSRTYTVNFTDNNGKAVDWNDVNFHWNVVSDFDVEQAAKGNQIELSLSDESFINSHFLLQCLVNDVIAAQIVIIVVEGW